MQDNRNKDKIEKMWSNFLNNDTIKKAKQKQKESSRNKAILEQIKDKNEKHKEKMDRINNELNEKCNNIKNILEQKQ